MILFFYYLDKRNNLFLLKALKYSVFSIIMIINNYHNDTENKKVIIIYSPDIDIVIF